MNDKPTNGIMKELADIAYAAVQRYPRINCDHPAINQPGKFFSNGLEDVLGEDLLRETVERVVDALSPYLTLGNGTKSKGGSE